MLSLSWDWASCFFAQLGMAPAPASPLSLVLPNPAEELWSWGWTSPALTGPISGRLEVKRIQGAFERDADVERHHQNWGPLWGQGVTPGLGD